MQPNTRKKGNGMFMQCKLRASSTMACIVLQLTDAKTQFLKGYLYFVLEEKKKIVVNDDMEIS